MELTFDELMARPAAWHVDPPDRSGLAAYRVAIRSPFDPPRTPRTARRGQELAWRTDLSGNPRRWAAAMVRLLRQDGQSRTFNRLVLDLTARQYTADTALGKAPEAGLWLAVERGLIVWADLEDGAVWFSTVPRCLRAALRPAPKACTAGPPASS